MNNLRVAPHNIEAERAVICSCIINKNAYPLIMNIIDKTGMFYEKRNELVFKAIRSLFNSNIGIDIVTISEALDKSKSLQDAGGAPYLVSISNEITAATHVEHYAKIVREDAIKRGLIRIGSSIIESAYDENKSEDIITVGMTGLTDAQNAQTDNIIEIDEAIQVSVKAIEQRRTARKEKKGELPKSGLPTLDRILGGFEGGKLYIVAARPSVGKSDIMVNWSYNISRQYNVLVFSAEMTLNALMFRYWALKTKFNRSHIRLGLLSDEQMRKLYDSFDIEKRNLKFDFTSNPSAPFIRSRVAVMKATSAVDIVFIDHLHEMSWHTKLNRDTSNWDKTTKFLRNIARDFNIPVVLLTQLSRKTETDKRVPILSDLRESGEEPADVVMMLHRENYQKTDVEDDKMDILIRKHRDGALSTIACNYNPKIGIISELANIDEPDTNYHEGEPF